MDNFNDLRGRHVDWSDLDNAPGGRNNPLTENPSPPKLTVVASEPTPPAVDASQGVLAPRGATVDDRSSAPAEAKPVDPARGAYLLARQMLNAGRETLFEWKKELEKHGYTTAQLPDIPAQPRKDPTNEPTTETQPHDHPVAG